jgi:hypothetical protein
MSSFTAAALLSRAAFSSGVSLISMIFSMPLEPSLHRHANEQSVDAVFAFQVRGAGQNLLLVFEDRLHHLGGRGRRGVVGAAGLQVLNDLGAAVAGALDHAVERSLVHQLGDGNAGDRRVARQRDHGVAVPAQHEGRNVFHRDIQFAGDKGAEARRIQNAGHADHAVRARSRSACKPPAPWHPADWKR